jgi:XTP/dITP diphosphohydrolase
MQRLLVASGNAKKLQELRALCEGLPLEVLGPWSLRGGLPEVIEDGATFAANAEKKACAAVAAAAAQGLDAWALADDSGLCVDALDGAPGVRSARFAGVEGPGRDAANNALLLERMRGLPPERRGAEFRCVLAVAQADGLLFLAEGAVRGRILEAPDGAGGFGYDPVFHHPGAGCSFARLSAPAKAVLSHRGRAMDLLRTHLSAALTQEALDRLAPGVAMSEKERILLLGYYGDGMSFTQIASTLRMTEARVCQIHANLVKRLRDGHSRR